MCRGASGAREKTGDDMNLCIRLMTLDDVPAGVELCRAVGWNQLPADWNFLRGAHPQGCFVAESDGQVVGTITTLGHAGRVAWVGMVIVDPRMRRLGIGSRLLRTALSLAEPFPCIGLDATPAGQPLYESLGFRAGPGLVRMAASHSPTGLPAPPEARPMVPADMPAVVALDATAFGAERTPTLEYLYAGAPEYAFIIEREDRAAGFAMGRHGHDYEHIGPIVAADPPTARALAATVILRLAGRPAIMDISRHEPEWAATLERLGFLEQRSFVRMVLGTPPEVVEPPLTYAIAGPELG